MSSLLRGRRTHQPSLVVFTQIYRLPQSRFSDVGVLFLRSFAAARFLSFGQSLVFVSVLPWKHSSLSVSAYILFLFIYVAATAVINMAASSISATDI